MPEPKEVSLDLRKQTVAGDGYTKLSQLSQVSRAGVRSIMKKFKGSQTVEKKPGRGRKKGISKTLEIKPVRDVSADPRTTAKTAVN